jgi:hypothetical protein
MADLKTKIGSGCPETGALSHFPKRTTSSPCFHFMDVAERVELKQEISSYVFSRYKKNAISLESLPARCGLDSTIPLSVIPTELFYQVYNFFQAPNRIGNACLHCRSDSQSLVDASEIVVHEMKGDSRLMVLDFL